MRNLLNSVAFATDATLGAATANLGQNTKPAVSAVPVAPVKRAAGTAKRTLAKSGKPAAKAKPAKSAAPAPSETVKPASKPAAATEAAPAVSERAIAHAVAAQAVAAFYSGASKPFKAAADRFQPLNSDNAKSPTTRQAALLLAMLTYSGGNIKPDGTFIRGGFRVPAKLVFDAAECKRRGIDPNSTLAAQPESGCLGNMLGRAVTYVSGPTSGSEQRDATFRLRPATVRAEIAASFGDKSAKLCDSIFKR